MSEKKELIFVGSGTEKFGGDLIEVTLNRNQLKEATKHALTQDGHGFFEMNGVHYVKLSVQKMRQPNEHGKTHSVSINTWKPDSTKQAQAGARSGSAQITPAPTLDDLDDDIPF
jgi:hypothetical protein